MSSGNGLDLLKPFLPGLEAALEDPDVSEIMINGPGNVWLEGHGRLRPLAAPALDAAALERAAIHIARPLGLDPATTPVLDARLGDGSRVAICVPPASPHVAITVRRFGTRSFSAAQLVEQGALPEHIRAAAERTLHTRRNILVSGGTGRLDQKIQALPITVPPRPGGADEGGREGLVGMAARRTSSRGCLHEHRPGRGACPVGSGLPTARTSVSSIRRRAIAGTTPCASSSTRFPATPRISTGW